MDLSRRDFLKIGGMGFLGTLIVPVGIPGAVRDLISVDVKPQLRPDTSSIKQHHWRFIIDIRKCIGCGRCVYACKTENDVPLEPEYSRTWVERYVVSNDEEVFVDSPDAGINGFSADHANIKYENIKIRKSFFVPKLCNHCQSPPCVQVCPVEATYSTREGVVLIDRKACIGCRYCIQACPYGARFLDPRLKVVDKCTWCYHRITKGFPPACVEVCPVGARKFGDIRDPESEVSQILATETVSVLKQDLGTEPMVYYIGLEKGVH